MHKLVLADDNLTTQRMIAMTMESEGHDVVAFADGSEALAHVRAHDVDLVLANIALSGLDGYSLSSQMREGPESAKVPVILLVGALDSLDEERAAASGAAAHLNKPFSSSSLLELTQRVIQDQQGAAQDPDVLFQVPVAEDDGEPVFQLEAGQTLPGPIIFKRVSLQPTVEDLAARDSQERLEALAGRLSETLPNELARLIPEIANRLVREQQNPASPSE